MTYCYNDCNDTTECPSENDYAVYCWQNYTTYLNWKNYIGLPPNPFPPLSEYDPACIPNVNGGCECITISETCGGGLTNCATLYPDHPDWVSHKDNCSNLDCGPPCDTAPPGCTANCACAANICFGGGSCSDGCGGTCNGIKLCSGTLTAKAVQVTSIDTSCNALRDSTNFLTGTTLSFSPAVNPASQTQAGALLTWTNVSTNGLDTIYTISGSPPPKRAWANTCVSVDGGAYNQYTSAELSDAGTLAFVIGYTSEEGWVQSSTGNVYAAGQLTASVPATATNPYFSLSAAGGSPGIVTYGTGFDFSLDTVGTGESMVSAAPAGWLTQQVYTKTNYFERFNQKLINETKTVVDPLAGAIPACGESPCIYTIEGQTTLTSPVAVGATEKIFVLVNGTLTINSNITIVDGGFLAFIVNGNITVDPAVTTLEGMYVASHEEDDGSFTGRFTSGAGVVQLTVHGSVIADTFSLERNLGDIANSTTPAEVFVFDPQLLFTMPDAFKETPYVWQEVAP